VSLCSLHVGRRLFLFLRTVVILEDRKYFSQERAKGERMGSYNVLTLDCPHCGKKQFLQSKAGDCSLGGNNEETLYP
jgi:hypothetical protein